MHQLLWGMFSFLIFEIWDAVCARTSAPIVMGSYTWGASWVNTSIFVGLSVSRKFQHWIFGEPSFVFHARVPRIIMNCMIILLCLFVVPDGYVCLLMSDNFDVLVLIVVNSQPGTIIIPYFSGTNVYTSILEKL